MIVTPLERLRYHVTSRSGQPPYLVDLGSYRKNGVCLGRCECDGFTGTLCPNYRDALPEFLVRSDFDPNLFLLWCEAFRCAHIRAARVYHFAEILDREVSAIREKFNDYEMEEE